MKYNICTFQYIMFITSILHIFKYFMCRKNINYYISIIHQTGIEPTTLQFLQKSFNNNKLLEWIENLFLCCFTPYPEHSRIGRDNVRNQYYDIPSSLSNLRYPLSAKFWRHCVLSGATQRRALPWKRKKEILSISFTPVGIDSTTVTFSRALTGLLFYVGQSI